MLFLLHPSFVWSPREGSQGTLGTWKMVSKNRVTGLLLAKTNHVIVWAFINTWYQLVTDGQTDGQTALPMPKSLSSLAERDRNWTQLFFAYLLSQCGVVSPNLFEEHLNVVICKPPVLLHIKKWRIWFDIWNAYKSYKLLKSPVLSPSFCNNSYIYVQYVVMREIPLLRINILNFKIYGA